MVGVEVLKYLMVKQAGRLRRDGVYKDKSHNKWWTDFSHVTSVRRARVGIEENKAYVEVFNKRPLTTMRVYECESGWSKAT